MSRKVELEQNIRESYVLIKEYEAIRRETDDPEERKRAERIIDQQWELIKGYWIEHQALCHQLNNPLADDIAEIATTLDIQNPDTPAESEELPSSPAVSNEDPKYKTTIGYAQAVALGDYAHVEQHFHDTPVSPPPATREELLESIRQASGALRSYSRDIAGIHIDRSEVQSIVKWTVEADPKQRLGMLQDQPGGGKTVVMRDVLEQLEAKEVPVLAIKADWLSGIKTTEDLTDRLGLPASVEECAKALASDGLFVVLLDQLDSLSLALSRDQATLDVMLSTLARLRAVENVRIVASYRIFELNNDPRLSVIEVNHTFRLQPLDDSQVNQVLDAIGIDPARLLPEHRNLITIPLHLRIYAQVIGDTVPEGRLESFQTLQDLYEALWDRRIIVTPPEHPTQAERRDAVYRLVDEMQARRQLTAPVAVLDGHREAAKYLRQEDFIRREGGNWLFAHQTLFDYCYARRFVAEGKSLSEGILAGPQGLFDRSQMVQVLAFLRGTDEATYRQELNSLLFSDSLRVHLRLLLIGWFGSLPDPTAAELSIARRLMRDRGDITLFLRAVSVNEGWYDQLKTDVVPSLLRSDDDQTTESTVYYLGALIQKRTNDVLSHLHPYLGQSETWDTLIMFCLSYLDRWQSDKALQMLCDLFKRGYTGNRAGHILYKLAHANPEAGCQALRAYLDRRLDDLLVQEEVEAHTTEPDLADLHRVRVPDRFTWNRELLGEYGVSKLVESATQECPETLIEHLLPWFIRALDVLTPPDGLDDQYPSDYLFSIGWYSEHVMEGASFAQHLAEALSHIAETTPDNFRPIARELTGVESLVAHRILAQAYLSNPQVYANDIFEYLVGDPRRLSIGEHIGGSPRYDSERLYGAAFRYITTQQRSILEQLILELQPEWEQHNLRSRGITQLGFFKTVSPEHLGEAARDRLGELERKFPGFERHFPVGVTGGVISSPIGKTAQEKMSNDAWLSAMRKYDESGYEHPDFLKGGVRQLSTAFSARVKKEPERFYHLAQRFDEDISIHYITAAISGLAESDAPAEWIFDLIRRFTSRLEGPPRRSVCWALEKRAEAGVPDDILDLMTDWALTDPDPTPRSWPSAAASDRSKSINEPYQRGINSNRGAALKAVCRCAMKRDPAQTERVWDLLEETAGDPSTAVRACVVENLRWVLNEDSERVLTILENTLDGHPRLLQCLVTHRLIYWTGRDHFTRLRPLVEALLVNDDDYTRQTGAEISCLGAFHYAEAEKLANQAMSGDPAMRRGAARVYARNLEYEHLESICRSRLLQLMNDTDQEVRTHVGNCFTYLRAEHLDRLRSFIESFIVSPALMDGAQHLVEYLAPLAGDDPTLALDVTEQILDKAGNEITDMRMEASIIERDIVRLPLMIYTHSLDPEKKSQAMDLFERLLLLGSRSAHQALKDWDRR